MASAELRDYLDTGKHKDGLNRCNKLLKKTPNDPRFLYFKASFLFGLSQHDEGNKILDQLCNTPITDLNLITSLDELGTTSQLNDHPRPLSNGPRIGKLWTNATNAAGKNAVITINRRRFICAVKDRRWADAGTVSLIGTSTHIPSLTSTSGVDRVEEGRAGESKLESGSHRCPTVDSGRRS